MESRPHILFVYPPAVTTTDLRMRTHFRMTLGSSYIIAYLREKGYDARQFQAAEPLGIDECAARILAISPRSIGFTVYDTNYFLCRLLAEKLKQARPDLPVIFGGPTATLQPTDILNQSDAVDICVRNEGEETCFQLVSLLDDAGFELAKTHLDSVKGITYRTGEGLRKNPGRDVLSLNRGTPEFLDTYPSPYLSGTCGDQEIGVITTRGCDQHCIYCNCSVLGKNVIAYHSIRRVIQELEYISAHLKKSGSRNVGIYDDAFTLLPGRAREICRAIIENKIKLPLSCITRCDTLDEEMLELLKEAGFRSLGFSLESAVPRLLRIIGKVHPPHTKTDPTFEKEKEFIDKFRHYAVYAREIGIDTVHASIMVGLPTETPEEGQRTVDFIHSMGNALRFYSHNTLRVYPGTPIFAVHEKYGMKLKKSKNTIHYQTIHSYDTTRIKPAPRSLMELDSLRQDKLNTRTMALTLPAKTNPRHFMRLVLCADTVTKKLLRWLRENMAVNGAFIHIYSSYEQAEAHHQVNQEALIEHMCPTNQYIPYYRAVKESHSSGDGTKRTCFIPYRIHSLGDSCGLTIEAAPSACCTRTGEPFAPAVTVGMDTGPEDVLALHRLLKEFSGQYAPGTGIFDLPVYPYFTTLCRWENNRTNCRTLDIVLVDHREKVTCCWNGEPIGKVGMPLADLKRNLENLRTAATVERNCKTCPKEAECSHCIYPAPVDSGTFCRLRREFDTAAPAKSFRCVELFKDIN